MLIAPNLFLVSFAQLPQDPITGQGTQQLIDAQNKISTQAAENKIIDLVCPAGSTVEKKTDFGRAFSNFIKAGAVQSILGYFNVQPTKSVLTDSAIIAASQDPIACSRTASSKTDCNISQGEQPAQDNSGNWKCFTAPISITRAGGANIGSKIIGIDSYKSIVPIPCQNLPGISNLNCAEDYSTPGQYILRLYQFALLLVGMAAFGQVVFGGLEYILAAGSFTKIDSAKARIQDALTGLLLLLGAYFVLFNINPDLVSLREPAAEIINTRKSAAQAEQDLIKDANIFTGETGGNTGGANGDGSLCLRSLNTGITVNTNIRFDGIQFMDENDKLTQLAKPADLPQVPQNVCLQCQPNSSKDSSGTCKCDKNFVQSGSGCVLVPTSL